MSAVLTRSNHLYPYGDGKPVAETDWHIDALLTLRETLRRFFAEDDTTYVAGNMLVFYEPGNKRRHVSPDVFVVKGVPKHQRPNFLVWEEKAPDLVVEFTSTSTKDEDLRTKFQLYRDALKVTEYFLFDPLREYLDPPEQGFRLVDGEYVPIEPSDGRFRSEVLGTELAREGTYVRVIDPRTGGFFPTASELAEQATSQAARESARADAAEAEVRRLRELLNRRDNPSG
jgi:Uma2 family endonuclease